jgi:hypothetical protein
VRKTRDRETEIKREGKRDREMKRERKWNARDILSLFNGGERKRHRKRKREGKREAFFN